MTIRTELESPLATYATANNIPVAWEGKAFTKPTSGDYLRIFFLNKVISNPDVEFVRKRTIGMVQIDVCAPDGQGSKHVEELAEAIASLYPSYNKQAFPTVSIESHPQIGKAMIDSGFRVIPITIEYRQES
jgi:hypothetical protein